MAHASLLPQGLPGQPGIRKRTNWQLVRWMSGLAVRHPRRCTVLLGLHLLLLGLSLSGLSLVGLEFDVIRHAVTPDTPAPRGAWGVAPPVEWSAMKSVVVIACVILGLAALQLGLRYVAVMTQARLIQAILTHLRANVYDKLQRLSFRFFDANETGSIINRATSDCTAIASFADVAIVQVMVLLVTLAVNLVYMIHIHPVLTIVCLGTTPLLAVASIVFSRLVRPAHEENRRLYDRLILTLSENIQGQYVVQGFGRQRAEIAKFHAVNDAYRKQQRWLFRASSLYSSVVGFMTQINLIVVLGYGGWLVIHHQIELGTGLIVFTALLQNFSNQVVTLAGIANQLQSSLTAAGRVVEVLDAPLEIQSKPNAARMPRSKGRVVFENVSFGYRASEPVLRDISFTVEPGQCVAVLGSTGAGKSTLLSLIPRFYDPSLGRITIDGRDLREIHLDDIRRNVGIVFQESFLFSNTVANNIAFGHPDATREQIERASKMAAAHEFVSQMSKGYDTIVGEYGSSLSGGQRQRLAIARALLLEPPILLLDDATSAVDPETEHEILEAMDNAMKGRTTFVVAHRLSTLRRANFIMVLEAGRIVEMGTHDELMRRSGGRYQEVARLQVGDTMSKAIIQARRWYEGEVDSLLDLNP